tara:strand:- start:2052 stop:5210 length:3159 start_codon:yes stop_codon:yes gene_type:complete
MKRFLTILLLPLVLISQDSWVEVEFQFDNYASEVSWSLYNAEDTISFEEGYYENQQPSAYHFLELDSATYTFELMDSYGDGLTWPEDGYCLISNACQDTLFYVSGDYGLGLIESLTIAPCAPPDPPVIGCMNESALNYNPDADVNDLALCEYPPCSGFGNLYVEQTCQGGSALLYYNWDVSENPNCVVNQITYGSTNNTNAYTFNVNIPNGTWGAFAGNGQMPPNWEEEFYFVAVTADSTVSDTLFYTPDYCTQGCTDESALNYNPWANIDDGSCDVATCGDGYTSITVDITLDNWPGETGWSIVSGGVIDEHASGDYNYQDIGQTFSYSYCVMEAGFEFIISDTFGDGLAGSTSGGSMDGDVVIRGCDGDTITQLSNGDWLNASQDSVGVGFGDVAYSGWQTSTICETEDLSGCTNPLYQEFAPWYTVDDGTCLTEHLFGCIDPTAFNYDTLATQMEIYSNCNYELWIGDAGADGWGNSFLGVIQGDNQWSFTMGPGQYEQTFPIWLETDKPVKIFYFEVGGMQTPPDEVAFQTLHNSFKLTNSNGNILLHEGWNPFADNGQGALQPFEPPFFQTYEALPFCGTLCAPTIEGCLDSAALNYDETANTDNGSCIAIVEGCTNDLAFNYDESANVDDSSCVAVVVGCMDEIAWNYNESANTDGGDCIYLGCTDVDACNYDSNANADSGGCTYPDDYYDCSDICLNDTDADGVCDEEEILGCTTIASINYNPEATDDDGSCVAIMYGCTNEEALNYDSTANTDNGSCIEIVEGCMEENAFNYNSDANVDDGSCVDVVLGCMDSTMFNYDSTANTDNGNCIPFIYGCMDDTMFNYNALANTENGTCVEFLYGCTDSEALNYDPLANTLDNSCCYIGGCMDSTALNYNELACYDDGGCITIVEDCMDNTAYNYNPLANVSNPDACLYDAGCYGGPGNPYWLNDGCYAWVIDADSYCCNNNWDNSCQDLYNYCAFGWPISIDELDALGVVVHPNPTTGVIEISTRLNTFIKMIDMKGGIITSGENISEINLSSKPPGMYNLIVEINGKQYIKKIIKQ